MTPGFFGGGGNLGKDGAGVGSGVLQFIPGLFVRLTCISTSEIVGLLDGTLVKL